MPAAASVASMSGWSRGGASAAAGAAEFNFLPSASQPPRLTQLHVLCRHLLLQQQQRQVVAVSDAVPASIGAEGGAH